LKVNPRGVRDPSKKMNVGHAEATGYHGGWAWAAMAALGGWASPAMGGWVAGQPPSSSFSFSFFSLFFFGRLNLVFFFFFFYTSFLQFFCFS
jgi:hypothetical protein